MHACMALKIYTVWCLHKNCTMHFICHLEKEAQGKILLCLAFTIKQCILHFLTCTFIALTFSNVWSAPLFFVNGPIRNSSPVINVNGVFPKDSMDPPLWLPGGPLVQQLLFFPILLKRTHLNCKVN